MKRSLGLALVACLLQPVGLLILLPELVSARHTVIDESNPVAGDKPAGKSDQKLSPDDQKAWEQFLREEHLPVTTEYLRAPAELKSRFLARKSENKLNADDQKAWERFLREQRRPPADYAQATPELKRRFAEWRHQH